MADLTRVLDDSLDAVRQAVIPDDPDERGTALHLTMELASAALDLGQQIVARERRYRAVTTLRERLDGVRLEDREPYAPADPPPDPKPEPPPPPPEPTDGSAD